MTRNRIDNLDGPLFPNGFEGDDDPIDQGSAMPLTESEKGLFKGARVRIPKDEVEMGDEDPNIDNFRLEGALHAFRIDSSVDIDRYAAYCESRGWELKIRDIPSEDGLVSYGVVFAKGST